MRTYGPTTRVGFGDAVTPGPEAVEFPTLLGMPPPRLRAHPRETVVAEKLEAMVTLGLSNSRMKDFFDLTVLARTFPFDGPVLLAGVAVTFGRRTLIPAALPVALDNLFAADEAKQRQWEAFRKRGGPAVAGTVGDLGGVVAELATFLAPVLASAAAGAAFPRRWAPGGPWVPWTD
jgi:hypothetical protein